VVSLEFLVRLQDSSPPTQNSEEPCNISKWPGVIEINQSDLQQIITSIVLCLSNVLSLSNIISFFFGLLASGIVGYHYYEKAKDDVRKLVWASRMDWLEPGNKVFLVAVLNEEKPIPIYSLLNWSGIAISEEREIPISIGSNGPVQINYLNSQRRPLLESIYGVNASPQEMAFQLTEYGKDCAEYLSENEIVDAKFDSIDSTNSTNLHGHYGLVDGPHRGTGIIATPISEKPVIT